MTATDLSVLPTDPLTRTTTAVSREERATRTRELLAAAAAEPERRAELLNAVIVLNCRVADAVAARFRHRGAPLEDLRQAAYEGLVKAVHHYDRDAADDLLTYAVPTIRGEVQRHLRDRTWLIRPPRHVQEVEARIRAAVSHLTEDLGREPDAAEICDYLGLDEADYRSTQLAMQELRCDSLDRPLGDHDTSTSLAEVLDRGQDDAAMQHVETLDLLRPALHTLTDRERRIVYLRFFEEKTQAQIGKQLGLGQAQVARSIAKILTKLRQAVHDSPDGRPAA